MKLEVDLSALPGGMRAAFAHLNRENVAKRILKARERQTELARAHRAGPRRSINGLGPQTFAIDPMVQDLLKDEYGLDADTPEFRAWLAREWDAVRVQSGGTRIQVGYGSGRIAIPRRRFMRTIARYT